MTGSLVETLGCEDESAIGGVESNGLTCRRAGLGVQPIPFICESAGGSD
jgi:hypothetical protein